MSVAREAGDRTKVAVRSHNPNVDAIGTIVGRGGANIKKITSKFHPARYDAKNDRMVPIEENIDVIEWVADPAEFIYNAIAPAEVDQVIFDETTANVPWWLFQITSFLLPSVVVDKTFAWRLT